MRRNAKLFKPTIDKRNSLLEQRNLSTRVKLMWLFGALAECLSTDTHSVRSLTLIHANNVNKVDHLSVRCVNILLLIFEGEKGIRIRFNKFLEPNELFNSIIVKYEQLQNRPILSFDADEKKNVFDEELSCHIRCWPFEWCNHTFNHQYSNYERCSSYSTTFNFVSIHYLL